MKSDNDIVTRLRAVLHNDRSVELMNREAADEIERLRDERDEARRMYLASTCSEDEIIHEMKRHGWDCYKEMKP
jgi:hypothetical protein